MNLTKDSYLEIAKNADDKTIVKMLSVNRKFNDDAFFQEVFNNKYPLLRRFKKENISWKEFYLTMIQHIALLKENFDFDYIPARNFNPISFYEAYSGDPEEIWNEGTEYAMETEDINFIRRYMLKGGRSIAFEYVITIATRMNRSDIVKDLIKIDFENNKYKKRYNPVYTEAIKVSINKHYQGILETLIIPTFRRHDLEEFLEYAIEKKNEDAINFLRNRLK